MTALSEQWQVQRQWIVLMALMAMFTAAVQARSPSAAYGEELVRVGAHWDEAFPAPMLSVIDEQMAAAQRGPLLQRTADEQAQLAALRAEVQRAEAGFGPYASGLEEPLGDLAMLEWRAGRVDAAQTLIERALHVTRVNGGLYTSAQRDAVGRLLAMHRLRGDFSGLDARYEYFFRLYGSGRSYDEPLASAAALEYLRWQREALRRDLPQADERLLNLHGVNKHLIDSLQTRAEEGTDPPRGFLQSLVFSQLRNLYLVQARVEPELDPRFSAATGSVILRQQPRPNSLAGLDITRERLLSVQRGAYAEGRRLLEQLLELWPAAAAQGRARVLRELGDWHQWHGSLRNAEQAYAEAIALLSAAGLDEQIAEAWGEPVELPDNGVFYQPLALTAQSSATHTPQVVLGSFVVTRSGRVQRIELYTADGQPLRNFRLVRELRATAFRPAYSNGVAVDAEVRDRAYELLE